MPNAHPALKVVLRRQGLAESQHSVIAVAHHSTDGLIEAWGDATTPIFPRSAIKMVQALPWAKIRLERNEIIPPKRAALASASHYGEPQHTAEIIAWLNELSLTEDALHCGAHAPFDADTERTLLREAKPWRKIHNNCSGKHLAMIESSLFYGENPLLYFSSESLCQAHVTEVLREFCQRAESLIGFGIDGCGVPAWQMPLAAFARALANFASPSPELERWRSASEAIFKAMVQFPELMGGRESFSSQQTKTSNGQFVVKVGAEGVMAVVVPQKKLGIAIKVLDGAERAAEIAVCHLLAKLGLIASEHDPKQNPMPVFNWAGEPVATLSCE